MPPLAFIVFRTLVEQAKFRGLSSLRGDFYSPLRKIYRHVMETRPYSGAVGLHSMQNMRPAGTRCEPSAFRLRKIPKFL